MQPPRKRRRTNSRTVSTPPPAPVADSAVPLNVLAVPVNDVDDDKKNSSPTKGKGIFNENSVKFRYGNYNRYYGKRLPEKVDDPRLKRFNPEWFTGKDVLDVGCNIGVVTLYVAKEFAPRRVVGIDIDGHLIGVARKNVRHYLDSTSPESAKFPISFARQYGPLSAPPCGPPPSSSSSSTGSEFPFNVVFKAANFVPADAGDLESTKPEFDVVLALSVSKWIHLNWGDDGLKLFFKRLCNSLKPGGMLILEPQPYSSYKKRKKLTPEIYKNFQSIQFKPEQFVEYLLSSEVGFSKSEVIAVPLHQAQGFRRPLIKFTKPIEEKIGEHILENVAASAVNNEVLEHTEVVSVICNESKNNKDISIDCVYAVSNV